MNLKVRHRELHSTKNYKLTNIKKKVQQQKPNQTEKCLAGLEGIKTAKLQVPVAGRKGIKTAKDQVPGDNTHGKPHIPAPDVREQLPPAAMTASAHRTVSSLYSLRFTRRTSIPSPLGQEVAHVFHW